MNVQDAADEPATFLDEPAPAVPEEGERRQLTVLFCDLVDSTAHSESLDPEDLDAVLRLYNSAAKKIIDAHWGHVAQIVGDGVVAYFGWPAAAEDDAERAVAAATELVRTIPQVRAAVPLAVRVGIATGEVLIRPDGDTATGAGARAVGNVPNLAARLLALAGVGEVVVSAVTKRLAGRTFKYTDRGVHLLKGFTRQMQVWAVVGRDQRMTRFEARSEACLTPLVAREMDLAWLRHRWLTAQAGDGQIVVLCGDAGIGKSRLIREFCRLSEAPIHAMYQCSSRHVNSVFYPVRQYLESLLACGVDASSEERLKRLEQIIQPSSVDANEVLNLYADLLHLPLVAFRAVQDSPAQRKQKLVSSMVRQVLTAAALRPGVVVFEDMHWADSSTLEFVQELVREIDDLKLLVIVTSRNEFKKNHFLHVFATHRVTRLLDDDVSCIVNAIPGAAEFGVDQKASIVRRADGVPLYAEELARSMLEQEQVDGGITIDADADADATRSAIPITLRDGLAARLGKLGQARELVQIGACIGRDFSLTLVAKIIGQPIAALRRDAGTVIRSGILKARADAEGDVLEFSHALLHEAAYLTLLRSKRQEVHAQIAQAMTAITYRDRGLDFESLAYHQFAAGKYDESVAAWREAGKRSVRMSANREAIGHFYHALDAVSKLPEGEARDALELDVLVLLGVPLAAVSSWADLEVGRIYARANALSEKIGPSASQFPALYGLWSGLHNRAEFRAAQDVAWKLLKLARASADRELIMEAEIAVGIASFWVGEFETARSFLEVALSRYDTKLHASHIVLYRRDPGVGCLSYLGLTLWCLGDVSAAYASSVEACQLAERIGHSFSLAWALSLHALVRCLSDDGDRGLELAERAIVLCEQHGIPFFLGWALVVKGRAIAKTGDLDLGLATVEAGRTTLLATGSSVGQALILGLKAELLVAVGRLIEGRRLAQEALSICESATEAFYKAGIVCVFAEAIFLVGKKNGRAGLEDARAMYERAAHIGKEQSGWVFVRRAEQRLAALDCDDASRDIDEL